MRIKRTGGSIHLPEMGKKQIVKLVLAVVLALVVIAASFFAVYWFSHRPGVQDNSTRALQNEGKTEVALSRGETCMLTLPENVDVRDVRFTSSDESIVRVDDAGRADGLAEGEATVSAKSKDFSASCVFHIGKAQPKQTVTEVTTAVTANQDALEKNRESGTADLFNIVVNRRTNTVTDVTAPLWQTGVMTWGYTTSATDIELLGRTDGANLALLMELNVMWNQSKKRSAVTDEQLASFTEVLDSWKDMLYDDSPLDELEQVGPTPNIYLDTNDSEVLHGLYLDSLTPEQQLLLPKFRSANFEKALSLHLEAQEKK